jgi:bacterioferritin
VKESIVTINADLQGVLGGQDETSAGQQELIGQRELIERRERIVELLIQAYWMEIETVMNYLAASVNPDGVRAREIARSLEAEVADELGHARQFAERIKELYGVVPGSLAFTASQTSMQPADEQTDVVHLIHGVIEAETGAIAHYSLIIEETDGVDYPTQDMVIGILRDEERHRRLFEGFLREYAPQADA